MDKTKQVEELIDKAAKADKSEDAVRYSQAACNVANSLCSLKVATNNPHPFGSALVPTK